MPVTAPADRRFRRAHIRPARKRAGLTWRGWWRAAIVVCVIVLALYAGHRAIGVVAALEMFQVDRINVRGNHRLSKGEVLAMLESLKGRSVLAVDLSDWRQALLNSPWVVDASLRKTLPSTIDVVILERAPLGIGRINGSLYLVDDRGAVIDDYGPNYADLDLPIIDGLSGHSGAADGSGAPSGRRVRTSIVRCWRGGCWMRSGYGTWRGRFRRSTSAIREMPSCCWKAIQR